MTPSERAQQIATKLFMGCSIDCKLDPNFKEVEWVAAQIEEAERETVVGKDLYHLGYSDGWNAARSKATGIADNHECEAACKDIGLGPMCTGVAADRISKMQPDDKGEPNPVNA